MITQQQFLDLLLVRYVSCACLSLRYTTFLAISPFFCIPVTGIAQKVVIFILRAVVKSCGFHTDRHFRQPLSPFIKTEQITSNLRPTTFTSYTVLRFSTGEPLLTNIFWSVNNEHAVLRTRLLHHWKTWKYICLSRQERRLDVHHATVYEWNKKTWERQFCKEDRPTARRRFSS